MFICAVFLIFTYFCKIYSLEILSLDGDWLLKDSTEKYNNLKATVPGGVYTDLTNNNIIGDVLFGYNDVATRWVSTTNWTYYRQFSVSQDLLRHENILITFDGIDTYATIFINNIRLGSSSNMFVRYSFNAKYALHPGTNNITIQFLSPVTIAETLTTRQNYTLPPECPPSEYHGECHANQIRKMQASFSWDWGPALPSVGIWKSVNLEAYNSTVIRYITPIISEENDTWKINITTYLSSNRHHSITGKLIFCLQTDTAVIQQIQDINESSVEKEIKVEHITIIPQIAVKRWWPNGYGEQNLYNLTVQFASGTEEISKTVRLGFRKIELIQDNIASGYTFYFKVNDVPIFAKGANEIPIDILPEKGQSEATIKYILQSAKDVHMNMLRVWGGGVYESDYFYDIADEMGILIWQDFMFACAMYPTYPNFLSNVAAEVRHQFKRLTSHPSIALWAGNNENEAALVGNWYGTQTNFSLYKSDYLKLYVSTIRNEVKQLSDSTIFLTSSPTNGRESDEEGYIANDPYSSFYGDVHFYNYIFNSLDIKTYPIPRFASEYGYQSAPDISTWLTTTNNLSDLDPNGEFMFHRQHHPGGNTENELLIRYQLNIPVVSATDYPELYFYYTQIIQALSIKTESEYYRSFQGRYTTDGKGNTMGALYWQLNDVWVAPTWSGIDYTGKWKMLHYFAKDFFSPTIITGYLNIERQLEVYAISDVISLIDSAIDIQGIVDIYNWNSVHAISRLTFNISLEFGKAIQVAKLDVDNLLTSLDCGSLTDARNHCFFTLSLMKANLYLSPVNFVLPGALKNAHLPQVNLTISSIEELKGRNDEKKFNITVQTDGIALFVWLDSQRIKGTFSENGFIQLETIKVITFTTKENINVDILKETFTVKYLNNYTYDL